MDTEEGPPGSSDRRCADAAARSEGADLGSCLVGEVLRPDADAVSLQRGGPSLAFHGDYYGPHDDDVCRGVTLPSLAVGDLGDISAAMAVPGDFYAPKQDAVRGLSLSYSDVEMPSAHSLGLEDFCSEE